MSEAVSQERTRNYLRQIKGAVVYKAIAMGASFLAIPLMIRYLGQEQFGVWSTLLSIMSWVVFFDLGIGNGMRNKVAEALARDDQPGAASYIASGYTLIGLIALALWMGVSAVSFLVPWQGVFNTRAIPEEMLRLTVQISAFFMTLNFWIGLIAALLGAVQKTSLTALGQLLSNVSALLLVYLLTQISNASIVYLAGAYGLSLVTANILLSLWFYRQYPGLRPTPRLDRAHARPLMSVGLQFFIIQLAVLVIFTTDKMLITQLFGPQDVTQYEVVFKLFSVITFAHMLITAPLWSAYTDAYHRSDFVWIKAMLRQQLRIFVGVAIAAFMMVLLARPVIRLWIGRELEVATSLIIMMGVFILVSAWNNIYAILLNGIGRIRVQLYTAVVAMLLNIPLAIFFTWKLGMDLSGIVLATCTSLAIAAVILPVQVHRMIRTETQRISNE